MKNPTVKDVIEYLNKCDQDAPVCRFEMDDVNGFYSSVEMIKKVSDTEFIDDSGNICKGDIIAIY